MVSPDDVIKLSASFRLIKYIKLIISISFLYMNIRQLSHFVAVVEEKSVTRAAKRLNIAQPALSISIRKFEEQLGLSLFQRLDRQMLLTQEGKTLLTHAQKILRQVDDAKLAMNELKGLMKGEVRLGTPSMMGSYYFPEIIMAFKSCFPNLKMTVVEAGTQDIRAMIMAGEIDVGVIRNTDVPKELEVDPLLRSQMVAVVGKQHEYANRQALSFEDFFSQELVMFKPGYFHRDFIDEVCKVGGHQALFSFETNLLPMILSIVKREFAITALLELVDDNESDLVGVPFEPPVYVDLALAWRKDGYLSKADKTFIDFVKQYSASSH